MRFNKLVEQLLAEMPYIELSNQIFDLEMEKYRDSPEKFVELIQSILQGNKHTDKYGNTIQLSAPEEKELFRKKIKLNIMIQGFVPGDLLDSI
jgi:hypothetical protein